VGVQRDTSFSEGFQQDLSDSHDDLVTKVFKDKNLLTDFSVSENNPQQQQQQVCFIYCSHIELMVFQLTFQVEISH
jgi:hypothetical protein